MDEERDYSKLLWTNKDQPVIKKDKMTKTKKGSPQKKKEENLKRGKINELFYILIYFQGINENESNNII